MDEKEYHLQSKLHYPKDLETSEIGINEGHEAIDDFVNKQRSENTKGRRLLIWSRYSVLLKQKHMLLIEANGLNSQTIESLPASELDHLSSIFFMNVRRKRRASSIFQFSAQYTAIL